MQLLLALSLLLHCVQFLSGVFAKCKSSVSSHLSNFDDLPFAGSCTETQLNQFSESTDQLNDSAIESLASCSSDCICMDAEYLKSI